MFHWAELLGLRAKRAAQTSANRAEPPIRLLAITTDDRFYSGLEEIASSSGWQIRRATTIDDSLKSLNSHPIPLVLFDWNDDGANWRGALERLSAAANHPCVLLASRVVDDNLRQEVIRFRGYDVLARSASRDQIVRSIEFAWFWTTRSMRFSDAGKKQEACH